MSRSSLYETFGGKRELFGRVVDNNLTEVIGPLLEPMEAPGSGRDDFVDYFLSLARFQRSAPRRVAARGCLVLNTFMELDDPDATAAAQVRGYRRRVRAAIRTSLTGSETAVRDVEATADLLTNSQIGVMATSRIDPIQAAELAEMVAADIRGLIHAAPPLTLLNGEDQALREQPRSRRLRERRTYRGRSRLGCSVPLGACGVPLTSLGIQLRERRLLRPPRATARATHVLDPKRGIPL